MKASCIAARVVKFNKWTSNLTESDIVNKNSKLEALLALK